MSCTTGHTWTARFMLAFSSIGPGIMEVITAMAIIFERRSPSSDVDPWESFYWWCLGGSSLVLGWVFLANEGTYLFICSFVSLSRARDLSFSVRVCVCECVVVCVSLCVCECVCVYVCVWHYFARASCVILGCFMGVSLSLTHPLYLSRTHRQAYCDIADSIFGQLPRHELSQESAHIYVSYTLYIHVYDM